MKKIISVLAALILLGYLFIEFFVPPFCENQVQKTIPLDNEESKLVVFKRACGATTSNSLHVSAFNANYVLDDKDKGNLLIADFVEHSLSIEENIIRITLNRPTKIYKEVESYQKFQIIIQQ